MQGGVISKAEKKEMVLRYVELELEEVWGQYPNFKDQTKTYNDFKDAILAHYPESSGKFLYSLSDIASLLAIGSTTVLGPSKISPTIITNLRRSCHGC